MMASFENPMKQGGKETLTQCDPIEKTNRSSKKPRALKAPIYIGVKNTNFIMLFLYNPYTEIYQYF